MQDSLFITGVALSLVKESDNLSRDMLPPSFLMVHDASRGSEDNVAKLTRGEQTDNPLFHVGEADVVAGRNASSLVDTSSKLDNNLARAVVIDLFEFSDIAMLLHDPQEFDNDLAGGPNQNLPLSSLLGIVDCIQAVVKHRCSDHIDASKFERATRFGER